MDVCFVVFEAYTAEVLRVTEEKTLVSLKPSLRRIRKLAT